VVSGEELALEVEVLIRPKNIFQFIHSYLLVSTACLTSNELNKSPDRPWRGRHGFPTVASPWPLTGNDKEAEAQPQPQFCKNQRIFV
jgi:hypothetical protein